MIKTTDDLRLYVSEVRGEIIIDDNLFWICCMFNADMILDTYSSKDIANMLLGGVPPFNTLAHVQEFIDGLYEDGDNDYNKAQCLLIKKFVLKLHNKHTEADIIQQEIDAINEGDSQ